MNAWAETIAAAFVDSGAVLVTRVHGPSYVLIPLGEDEELRLTRQPDRGPYELRYYRDDHFRRLIATGHELMGVRMALRAELVRASLT